MPAAGICRASLISYKQVRLRYAVGWNMPSIGYKHVLVCMRYDMIRKGSIDMWNMLYTKVVFLVVKMHLQFLDRSKAGSWCIFGGSWVNRDCILVKFDSWILIRTWWIRSWLALDGILGASWLDFGGSWLDLDGLEDIGWILIAFWWSLVVGSWLYLGGLDIDWLSIGYWVHLAGFWWMWPWGAWLHLCESWSDLSGSWLDLGGFWLLCAWVG